MPAPPDDPLDRPQVFISYSHDSDDHREKVLDFVYELQANHVDAEVDHFRENTPPPSWPRWMHSQITRADWVIMVCTPTYKTRVEGEEAPGQGLGARWEGAVLTHELYAAESDTPLKCIPVMFSPDGRECVPYFAQGTNSYALTGFDDETLEPLLRHLFREPKIRKMPLGPRPKFTRSRHIPPPEPRQNSPREISSVVAALLEGSAEALAASRGADRSLDKTLHSLRKTMRAFADLLTATTGQPCRCSVRSLVVETPELAAGDEDQLRSLTSSLLASSGGDATHDLRMPVQPVEYSTDLTSVIRSGGKPFVAADIESLTPYMNPSFWTDEPPSYRSCAVWPIAGPAGQDVERIVGFLTADSRVPGTFAAENDRGLVRGLAATLFPVLSLEPGVPSAWTD